MNLNGHDACTITSRLKSDLTAAQRSAHIGLTNLLGTLKHFTALQSIDSF